MKAIFFNAKRVIYFRPNPHFYLQAFLESQNLLLPPEEKLREAGAPLKDQVTRGRLIPELYNYALLKACGVINPVLLTEGSRAIERDRANISLFPGVIPTLEKLKMLGFKLGIITDSTASREVKEAWMRACGLRINWDAYANSRDLQAVKPAQSMYQAALLQAEVSAAEAVFVGHHQVELVGARQAGLATVAFQSATEITADFHIQNFDEILRLPFISENA